MSQCVFGCLSKKVVKIPIPTTNFGDSPHVCEECLSKIKLCDGCGRLCHWAAGGIQYYPALNKCLCVSCLAGLTRCGRCNSTVTKTFSMVGDDGEWCDCCAPSDRVDCPSCGRTHRKYLSKFRLAKWGHLVHSPEVCPDCFTTQVGGGKGRVVGKCHFHSKGCSGYSHTKITIGNGTTPIWVCSECLPNAYFCNHCKKYHLNSEYSIRQVGNGETICSACYNANYYMCHCGGVFLRNAPGTKAIKGRLVCGECLSAAFTCAVCKSQIVGTKALHIDGVDVCVDCGRTAKQCEKCCTRSFYTSPGIHHKDQHYQTLCGPCRRESHTPATFRYNFVPPILTFHGEGDLHYGVELEFSGRSESGSLFHDPVNGIRMSNGHLAIAQHIHDNVDETTAFAKWDGSVTNGYEVVTHPRTFDSWVEFDAAKLIPPDISRSSSCGMHIHMSKKAFGAAHLYQFLCFFHDFRSEIVAIAGRDYNRYCKFVGKEALEAKSHGRGDKYENVNVSKRSTVEVRVFAGIITVEELRKNIEFCDAVYHYTRETTKGDALLWEDFITFVGQNRSKYNNLINFMTQKGLI